MKRIIVFRKEEQSAIETLLSELESGGRENEITTIKNNRDALRELAGSISLYPSILKEQQLGSATRTVETLVNSMCRIDQLDVRLHIPTKALLGNGYLIAKVNFFYMLLYLSEELPGVPEIKDLLKSFISSNISTLMAEEVFLAIIEDGEIQLDIRMNAGYLLANIWEYRLDHGVKEFAPILSDMWKAREKLVPVFGTMLGFSELFKMSEHIEPAFFDFIQRDELTEEEIASIEEFVFGLSFEEMEKIREEMERRDISVLGRKEVEDIIGPNRIYPEYRVTDLRDLYRSFRHRKSNARYRTRANHNGPHKTIEEYIMCYLLSLPVENG